MSSSKAGKERAPYWDQLRVLLQRTARVRRFEQMTGQHFFQLFAVAFITGMCCATGCGGRMAAVVVLCLGDKAGVICCCFTPVPL